jgi:putative NADPH-quinone reductase
LKVLVVFSHPSRSSLCGSILEVVLKELETRGDRVELLDLYVERFDPVLSLDDWMNYEATASENIQRYVDQIRVADGLIWIFPTWNYGLPAILKGYVDRIWKPNVAFRLGENREVIFDRFAHLRFFVAITTFGAGWLPNTFVGNPCKRVLSSGLRRHFPRSTHFNWLALYDVDRAHPRRVDRFINRIKSSIRALAVN